jgi:two-component system, LytTR family, response regulator
MNILKAILIDDEESGLNSLRQKILQHCPSVEIIAACNKPADGLAAINSLLPDLVFLDIEMPLMNGFTLLQQLTFKNFELIFVTAYDHYAIKAIHESALDYLVKPVEIDALTFAVKKALEKKENEPNKRLEVLLENASNQTKKLHKIAIPTFNGINFIKIEDIIYLEASGNYTKFYLTLSRQYIVSRTLKEFEDILPNDLFIRIHNSYVINLDFAEKYIRGEGGQIILSGNIMLEVSKRKKNELLKIFFNK